MPAELELASLDAAAAGVWLDRLVTLYLDVYGGGGGPFHTEERYRRQLDGHLAAPRWLAVTACRAGELIGYAYGFSLSARTRWWSGLITELPADFGVENGHRTFAISEILVRADSRRLGVGRALHGALLRERTERRATLLVEPSNLPAQAAYASWGWHRVGQLRPSWPHAPVFDVLVLPLPRPASPDVPPDAPPDPPNADG